MNVRRRELLKSAALSSASVLFCNSNRSWVLLGPPHRRSVIDTRVLRKFSERFRGQVTVPGDSDYEPARSVASFNPSTDKHPRIIARCADFSDVAQSIQFARDHLLEVAVRAGGFDVLGASVCEGGMVIDLSRMKAINIDSRQRLSRVQAGVRSAELSFVADAYGLAAALGCHPGVGIAGLTLGGGLGWLAGKYGASCDNLRGADVITAEGRMIRANETENPDLFWAIRGGGGNFGVITSFDFQLHPVDKVFGGVAAYRGDLAAFLRFFGDFMKAAPDELTVELSIRVLGEPTILATACWSGDLAEGERVLRPLREFEMLLADAFNVVPYAHLIDRPGPEFGRRLFGAGASPPPLPSGRVYDYWRGGSLQKLTNEAAETIAAATRNAPPGWSIGLGHYMHGVASSATLESSSVPRNAGQFTYFFDANWRDLQLADSAMSWVDSSLAAMRSYSSTGTYVNYLSTNSDAAVRASYGQCYERLAALKRKYDSTNFFHLNRNVRPSESAGKSRTGR